MAANLKTLLIMNLLALRPSEPNPQFKVVSTNQAIIYLDTYGIRLKDSTPKYQIPSGYGRVYTLQNGEVVLIGSAFQDNYPAFVFNSFEDFETCCKYDYFPLPSHDMSWAEANALQIKDFLIAPNFYLQPLHQGLGISVPFQSAMDCEAAYLKIHKYVRSKSNSTTLERTDAVGFFALAMAQYLIEKKGYRHEVKKRYFTYNPGYTPVLTVDDKGEALYVEVLSTTDRHLSKGKPSFRNYYWEVAGVPVQDKIE